MVLTTIFCLWAASVWQATVYDTTVVEPREAAARRALIESEIAPADALFDRGKYETAVSEYDYVLAGFAGELPRNVEGRLYDRVGFCHVSLALTRTGDPGRLETALDAYHMALDLRTVAAGLRAHFETRSHMADAYMTMSRLNGEAVPVSNAINLLNDGLVILSNADNAELYARGLRALGNAHRRLYELEAEANPIDRALSYYAEALRVAGPVAQPVVHGETLIEIGLTRVLMSEGRYRERELQAAITAFEKALRIFTVEAHPRLHARTHKNMGDTYTQLSSLEPKNRSDRARHQQRVIRYQNKARQSYRIAKSFGFEAEFAAAGTGGSAAAAEPVAESKE